MGSAGGPRETLAATDPDPSRLSPRGGACGQQQVAAKLAAHDSTVGGVERLGTDRRHAATTDPSGMRTSGSSTRRGRGGSAHRPDAPARPCRPDDQDRSATTGAGQQLPDLDAVSGDQVTGGVPELQSYLQRMFGYCLTGATSEHALFFLYGTGANGKSVFVTRSSPCWGLRRLRRWTPSWKRGDRHPTDLAGLRGSPLSALLNRTGRRWNKSKIRRSPAATGVPPASCAGLLHHMCRSSWLPIAGNHKPAIRNIDEAMRRRLHLIPSRSPCPGKARQAAADQLLAEANGIFSWGVEGAWPGSAKQ